MQILNAKRSAIVFKLDNGSIKSVGTGKLSEPFLPSLSQVRDILSLGTPDEIAILITNSRELSLLRELNGSIAYLCNSEEEARNKLFKGKEVDQVKGATKEVNIEAEKLKIQLASKDKEIAELRAANRSLNDQIANSPIEELRNKLKVSNEELTKLNSNLSEAQSKIDSLMLDVVDREKEIASIKEEKNAIQLQLNEANSKLESSVLESNANTEKLAELSEKLKEANNYITNLEANASAGIPKEDYDAKVAELEASKKENEQLKSDGAVLVENYKKAKDAMVHVMNKFNITFDGSDYVING